MELVTPNLGLIIWMTLSFSALLWILTKYAWKPVLKMLKEREDTIENALLAAEKTKEEMLNLKSRHEELLKEAKEEKASILREARKIKDSIVEEAKTKATEEANNIIETAKESIHYEKMAAITDLKNQVAKLSIEISEKILRQELTKDKKQEEFINKLVEEAKFN